MLCVKVSCRRKLGTWRVKQGFQHCSGCKPVIQLHGKSRCRKCNCKLSSHRIRLGVKVCPSCNTEPGKVAHTLHYRKSASSHLPRPGTLVTGCCHVCSSRVSERQTRCFRHSSVAPWKVPAKECAVVGCNRQRRGKADIAINGKSLIALAQCLAFCGQHQTLVNSCALAITLEHMFAWNVQRIGAMFKSPGFAIFIRSFGRAASCIKHTPALLKRCGLTFMLLACKCDPMHSKYVELFAASPELFLWVPRGADKAWCHATEAAKAAGCTGVIILDDNLRSFSVASEHGTTLLSNSNVKLMFEQLPATMASHGFHLWSCCSSSWATRRKSRPLVALLECIQTNRGLSMGSAVAFRFDGVNLNNLLPRFGSGRDDVELTVRAIINNISRGRSKYIFACKPASGIQNTNMLLPTRRTLVYTMT